MVSAIPTVNSSTQETREAWNQAHRRLESFLASYAVADRIRTAQLVLTILSRAQEVHRQHPAKHPTTVTLELARQALQEWLVLFYPKGQGRGASVHAGGHIALLLAQIPQAWPESFLAADIPKPLKSSLQQSLMITGPDLNISSMTPRELDYGPLLQIARQTWHRWDSQVLFAFLFWVVVYVVLYWIFSQFI